MLQAVRQHTCFNLLVFVMIKNPAVCLPALHAQVSLSESTAALKTSRLCGANTHTHTHHAGGFLDL